MLCLTPFKQHDIRRLISWIPDKRFMYLWGGPNFTFPLTENQILADMKKTEGECPECLFFNCIISETSEIIGHIELRNIDYEQKAGRIGRVIIGLQEFRGRGYGKEMVGMLLQYAFGTLLLEKLTLGVFDFNDAALSCYTSLGFVAYETKENYLKCDDEYWNLINMELYSTTFGL